LIIVQYCFVIFELLLNNIRLFLIFKELYACHVTNNSKPEITMQIEIQARNFSLTEALRIHIQRRLGFALSTRFEHIKRIMVRLSDINGPRGGNDKCCHIQVVLPGQADVVIEDTESNLYVAIDRAADRASRTVTRRLGRLRDKGRPRTRTDTSINDTIQPFEYLA
jgi:ribosomal subunit interface protein